MWIYFLIAGIVAIFVLLLLLAPRSATVERSITVDVPQEQAFDFLRSLERFHQWSPWTERDPAMQHGMRGTDGEIGSVNWWSGNKEVGEGEQEIVKLEPNSHIGMELRFIKPFRATNQAWLNLVPDGQVTKVNWGFHAKFPPLMNIMMMFMNLDKAVGKDYEAGLKRMKKMIESTSS